MIVYRWSIVPDGDGWRILTDDVISPAVLLVLPHALDDVASVRVDLARAVVVLCALPLPEDKRDDLIARLDWRLRDARAP